MGLPTPKMPLPGFRLIADAAGNYIDDVNNFRLSDKFTLNRNTADPSAAIDIDPTTIVPNSGSSVGRMGVEVLLASNALSASSSSSVTWTAGAYRKIRWVLKLAAGSGQSSTDLTFAGSTGTLVSAIIYYGGAAAGTISPATQGAHWRLGYTGQVVSTGTAEIASGQYRSVRFNIASSDTTILGVPFLGDGTGYDPDTTHDFTGCTFAFNGGNANGTLEVWGLP